MKDKEFFTKYTEIFLEENTNIQKYFWKKTEK